MVFSAVFTANFFNGLNTSAWTGWVFFAVFIGDVLVWIYTVSHDFSSQSGLFSDYYAYRLSTTLFLLDGSIPQYGVTTTSCSHQHYTGYPSL